MYSARSARAKRDSTQPDRLSSDALTMTQDRWEG
jgi:hypothetical protein